MIHVQEDIYSFRHQVDNFIESLNYKKILICSHGIGDMFIVSRVAKLFNCGILQKYCPGKPYRRNFSKELADLENIKRMEFLACDSLRKHLFWETLEKYYSEIILTEFDIAQMHKYTNIDCPNKFMNICSNVKFNIEYMPKDSNLVFVCPHGSSEDDTYVRYLSKNDLDFVIDNLKKQNKKIMLVGIKKDIEKYGYYENVPWINTNQIIYDKDTIKKINIKTFLELISSAWCTITVNTFFQLASQLLGIETYIVHMYNKKGEPVLTNEDRDFFVNFKWFNKIHLLSVQEIIKKIFQKE